MSTVKPRKYQEQVVSKLVRMPRGKRIALVAPTGSGKTVVAASVIKRQPRKRVLFIAHRKEILRQTLEKLTHAGVALEEIGVVSAGDAYSHPEDVRPEARIQICGVQTLARRELGDFKPDIIFVDECHHVMAESYRKIVDAYPDASVYGLTATPQRRDGKALSEVFNDMIVVASIPELIEQRFLARPISYSSEGTAAKLLKRRLRAVKISGGDFNQAQLGRAMNNKMLTGDTVKEWKRLASDRQTIVFAADVAHSKALCARFKAAGVKAVHIDGDSSATALAHRARALADFRSGAIQMICNVDVLGEGWDEPVTKCVVMARPTRSLTVFMQQVGRALRPHKHLRPLVLDHAGNCARFDLPDIERKWSLNGRAKGERLCGAEMVRTCPECGVLCSTGIATCECGHAFARKETQEDIAARLVALEGEQFKKRLEAFAQQRGLPGSWVAEVMSVQS